MFLPGSEVGLAEAYLDNDFVIEGDIEAAFEIGDFLLSNLGDWKGAFQKLERARLRGRIAAKATRDRSPGSVRA